MQHVEFTIYRTCTLLIAVLMDLRKWYIAPLHKVNKGLSKGSRVRMEGE